MGEIKSVKVDNWGVFFLQKLQNFFNKTDYCDLTLQFRDNSQLKVHRLVLSACTDYFNVLEQTCEMVDDALIMPNELQADVVVPIVNFMYTGTLEFELKMYGKLLRTAKDMNMTVLLKLLEAHRRTMEGVNRLQRPPTPKTLRRHVTPATSLPTQQQRRVLTSPNSVSGMQRRIVQTKSISTSASTSTNLQSQTQFRQQIGATSLIRTSCSSNTTTMQGRTQYVNQPAHETQTVIKQEPEEITATSPFEQLRKGYNNNKRPANNTLVSPPAKKLNIEDVKEFAEQQRMRKQIAAEYGDDQGEYENTMMEDDIHNDDDDDDLATTSANSSAIAGTQASTSRQTQLQHGATTITINQNEKPPTIVVKDSSNSKMNHAKIIKEVLRQYPHLVKSNKNIKLKIMPSSGDQPQKIIVKKEQLEHISSDPQCSSTSSQPQSVLRIQSSSQTLLKPLEKPQVTVHQTTPPPPVVAPKNPVQSKAPTTSPTVATSGSSSATSSAVPTQKRRIDSKTMHALIALGAENTTGPWLCLRCGVNGRPISIPSYRGFRRHLINTHKEYIDPALCEHCGWRSSSKRELHFHMEMEHKIKTTSYTFPQCLLCSNQFLDTNALNQHMVDAHPDENKQQCIYCNKIFARELQLYNHMKTYHKKQALEDGIIDYSDDELFEQQGTTEITTPEVQDNTSKEKKESKIKIISDISLPSAGAILNLENSNVAKDARPQIGVSGDQQEFMETTESSIITSEPKFVTVDGNEMVLTDEQRQEIMAQLNQEHGAGGVVMVLNEPSEYTAEQTPMDASHVEMESSRGKQPAEQETDHSAEQLPEEITDEENRNPDPESSTANEDFDDGQIYNELHTAQGRQGDSDGTTELCAVEVADDKKNTLGGSALDESKESIENLEWAENLISAHELADQEEMEAHKKDKENKSDDAINQKLKELTGDWSEDENDDDQQDTAIMPTTEADATEDTSNTVQNEVEEKDEPILDNQKTILKSSKDLPEKFTEPEVAKAESENLNPAEDNVIPQDDNLGYTNTNADDSKGEEDDLDTLMKNLHKDDGDLTDIRSSENEDQGQKTDDTIAADLHVIATKKEKLENPLTKPDAKEAETILKIETEKVDKGNVADSTVEIQRDILLDKLIGDDDNASKEAFIKETVPAEKTLKATGEESSTLLAATLPTKALEAMEVEDAENEEDVKEQSAITDSLENKVDAAKDSALVSGEKSIDDVAKTSERVKSLISEWAEDDEEEEQDTAVPTAITEADEEQL